MNVLHVTGNSCPKLFPMRLILVLSILLLLCATLRAQTLKPIKIGDPVPAALWQQPLHIVNHPQGKTTLKLADYKDKLIVLDFWATHCTACIAKLPQLYKLQTENSNSIQVVLVNSANSRDDDKKIARFFEKRKDAYRFWSVSQDSVLTNVFPHDGVPYYVFIRDGIVTQIADGIDMGHTNINDLIKAGETTLVHAPHELPYDSGIPLFVDGNGGTMPADAYSSLLTHNIPGLMGGIAKISNADGLYTRSVVISTDLVTLYRCFYPELRNISWARTVINLPDPAVMRCDYNRADSAEQSKLYNYEASFPPMTEAAMNRFVQKDLDRYFSLKVAAGQKEINCWVLKAVNPAKALDFKKDLPRETNLYDNTGGATFLNNYRLAYLLTFLEDLYNIPFIDETGIDAAVKLSLPAHLDDIHALQLSLAAQGFKLVQESRTIDIVTIDKH